MHASAAIAVACTAGDNTGIALAAPTAPVMSPVIMQEYSMQKKRNEQGHDRNEQQGDGPRAEADGAGRVGYHRHGFSESPHFGGNR